MENNTNQETQTTEKKEKSFDELLHENPQYQSELDKKLSSAKAKWEETWKQKAEADKLEAERLAKLSEAEKMKEQLDKANADKDAITRKYDAIMLKQEAQNIAKEKGVDTSLLDLIDFSNENAESVKTKIEKLSETFGKAVQKSLDEKLKQSSPEQHNETSNKNGGSSKRATF